MFGSRRLEKLDFKNIFHSWIISIQGNLEQESVGYFFEIRLNTSYTEWFIAKNASETNQLEIELDISCVADSNTLGKIFGC